MERSPKTENSFMIKFATFIVDKHNLFFLLTIICLVFRRFPGTGLSLRTT